MISFTDVKYDCGLNARPWIVVNEVRHVKYTDDISNSLMDLLDDCIVLGIPSCYMFPFEAIVVLTHLAKFIHKFDTAIKHNSLWKWVTSKPSFLGDI